MSEKINSDKDPLLPVITEKIGAHLQAIKEFFIPGFRMTFVGRLPGSIPGKDEHIIVVSDDKMDDLTLSLMIKFHRKEIEDHLAQKAKVVPANFKS